MDDNYLYIIGFLGFLLVTFIVYYLFTSLRKQPQTENIENTNIQEHVTQDDNIECDGDKCFIKHKDSKYDKCDDNKCI